MISVEGLTGLVAANYFYTFWVTGDEFRKEIIIIIIIFLTGPVAGYEYMVRDYSRSE